MDTMHFNRGCALFTAKTTKAGDTKRVKKSVSLKCWKSLHFVSVFDIWSISMPFNILNQSPPAIHQWLDKKCKMISIALSKTRKINFHSLFIHDLHRKTNQYPLSADSCFNDSEQQSRTSYPCFSLTRMDFLFLLLLRFFFGGGTGMVIRLHCFLNW